uniref:Uncharacterized protein n=1 Tax=Trichobilharzia regenti TaxID=157069 RepID=A0AA85ILU7_TRIRE|nr:unnamed protein product [Trichobilharzia regenti]
MESLWPAVFDEDIWIFGQDFELSAQLSGVQDLSLMRLLLGTLLGGQEKAAYGIARRNTNEYATGSAKQFPKWEAPHMVTLRWSYADTIAILNEEKQMNTSEYRDSKQQHKRAKTLQPRKLNKLQLQVFDGGTSVMRAGF